MKTGVGTGPGSGEAPFAGPDPPGGGPLASLPVGSTVLLLRYQLHDKPLAVIPKLDSQRPDPEFLRWHPGSSPGQALNERFVG